jgi:hypothetical protein
MPSAPSRSLSVDLIICSYDGRIILVALGFHDGATPRTIHPRAGHVALAPCFAILPLQAECGSILQHVMSAYYVPPARVLGNSKQLAELGLGIFAGSKRIADFAEEGFAVVFAQPVESGAEGGFGAAEFLRKLSIRWRVIVRQMGLQCGEEGGLFAGIFSAQPLEAACQEGAKPEAVVGGLGLLVADEFTFDALGIEREVGGAPAAALRVGVPDLADEIAAKGDLEESTHSPAFRTQRIEIGAADELRDEALH